MAKSFQVFNKVGNPLRKCHLIVIEVHVQQGPPVVDIKYKVDKIVKRWPTWAKNRNTYSTKCKKSCSCIFATLP